MTLFDIPLSIYLHVPFCRVKCTYCAFNTYVHLDSLIEPFVDALIREIAFVGGAKPKQPVWTVFFGGGTPSMLTPAQFKRILDAIRAHFALADDAEISLEANPGDLDLEYLTALRRLGINRISIGMQSANANELALFHRRHDNDAVVRSVSAARAAGFDNLNLDVIYGAPHQTLDSWETTLRQMIRLRPEHVSLYALGLEDNTLMKTWVERGRLPEPDDDLAADMYELATTLLAEAGLEQYEISNWSMPGRQCQHNLQYWRNWPYVGVGPGAHGFAGGVRYSTVLAPQRYIRLLTEQPLAHEYPLTPAADQAVKVDRDAEIAETLIMSLRLTQEGISRRAFADRFGADLLDVHPETIARYRGLGLLEVTDERVRITQQGRLLSNMIFRDLV
jgi:oxygen-independent coproporphyrinogen-3 oxidase